MTCESFEELISLHVEGDLPATEAAGVKAHLAACARCRTFAEEIADSQRSLRELAAEDLDTDALADVRRRVQEAVEPWGGRRSSRRFGLVGMLSAAAAIAVVAVLLQREQGRPPAPIVAAPHPAVPLTPAAPPLASRAREPVAPPRPVVRESRDRKAPAPRGDGRSAARPPEAQSELLIKLVTSDPDIVIYWLVDQNGGKS